MFCGMIDQQSAQRIMAGVNSTTQNNQRMHLLFQSTGGIIGDGVCLHNYFKACPTDLILYNIGTVSSIGVVAYLGASVRVASAGATFMIHSTTSPAIAMTAEHLNTAVKSLRIDDERIKTILNSQISITNRNWSNLRHKELWFTATDALKSGIITAIGNFSPPRGALIYTL